MKRSAWLLAFGLTLAGAVGCRPAGQGTRNLVLTGSNVMAPLVQEIGQRFEAQHPGVRVDVQRVGSDRGVSDTHDGLADVGMVARPLRPEEAGLHSFVVARDGLGLIVHPDNPVTALTNDQVVRLYTGAATNWKQVGGADVPVTLVNQADGRSAQQMFLAYFKLKAGQLRSDLTAETSEQGIEAVAGRPGAIAYVSVGLASAQKSVRLLPLAGVPSTPDNLRNGSYPLPRPLLLVTREPPGGLAREFIDFAQSAAVDDLVAKYHFLRPARGAATH